jgi:hypothetical protein
MSRIKVNSLIPFSGQNITFGGNAIPSGSNKTLGTTSNPWADLYVGTSSVSFVSTTTVVARLAAIGEEGIAGAPSGMMFTWDQNNLRGSFSVGKDNIASGTASLANGQYNTASGNYSHAEGLSTQATSIGAHAEGSQTIALGQASHAEGSQTLSSGLYSHAEGFQTRTLGLYSHAEGYLATASGLYSHAEGKNTLASGQASHAEGLYTIAAGDYQTVVGRYNVGNDTTSRFIVGNGDFESGKDAFKVTHSSSIVVAPRSAAPSWTGTEGEMVPFVSGSVYRLYAYLGGAWRSSSFV